MRIIFIMRMGNCRGVLHTPVCLVSFSGVCNTPGYRANLSRGYWAVFIPISFFHFKPAFCRSKRKRYLCSSFPKPCCQGYYLLKI